MKHLSFLKGGNMSNDRESDIICQIIEQDDKIYKKQRSINKMAVVIYILSIVIFICGGILSYDVITGLQKEIKEVTREKDKIKKEKDELEDKNLSLYEENEETVTAYNSSIELLQNVAEVAVELDEQNKKIVDSSKRQARQLKRLQRRKRLMSNYEWALYDEEGIKTDISFEDIETLRSLCKKKNLSDDTVDLVLAIAMTESGGNAKCTNSTSTALGFGQFIEETGRITYTFLMGHESYNHRNVALNGTTNLKMILYYLEYLDMETNGDIDKIIDRYRGLRSAGYKRKINKYLSNRNKSLKNIKITNN